MIFSSRSIGIYLGRRFCSAVSVSIPVGSEPLRLESGKLARFADGCAVCHIGDTSVMVTAVSRTKPYSNFGFVPLTVDYRRKAAAAGRIPTNFLRRELGPTDTEILTSRIIDRSLRVLFPKNYSFDTQIVCNVLAADSVHDPDVAAVNAASTALTLSDIPWNGPVGSVRMGHVNGQFVVNPDRYQLNESRLNMVLTGASNRRILMVELSANELPISDVIHAVNIGLDAIENIISGIQTLHNRRTEAGILKPKRQLAIATAPKQVLFDAVRLLAEMRLRDIFENYSHDKISRDHAVVDLRQSVLTDTKSSFPEEEQSALEESFNILFRDTFRQLIFDKKIRVDGRNLTQLRPIECAVDLYKPLHGSALFQRGQTQVLCTVSFDSAEAAFRSDPLSVLMGAPREKQFLLHYEFPPYATNEIGSTGGRAFGRRELGHGALAEKALKPVLPARFPFTIRLTSEVLESNGSSSMASVCGGCLALMDAGVQIKTPVSGVAMGMVARLQNESGGEKSESTQRSPKDYLLLTDILGIEDYSGDMDFKIAGTKNGLTAAQLDLKVPGISVEIFAEALDRAHKANGEILDIMAKTIQKPRDAPKSNGPVVENLIVPPAKRHRILGTGGLTLKRLESDIGVRITQLDDTTYSVFAPNMDAWNEVKEKLEKLLSTTDDAREAQLEFGGVYEAKIVEIRDGGVMVQLYPEMTPVLVPNSQLDTRKVQHPTALGLSVGQTLMVKYFGRDAATGHMRLSKKVLQRVGEPAVVKDFFESKKTQATPGSPWTSSKIGDKKV